MSKDARRNDGRGGQSCIGAQPKDPDGLRATNKLNTLEIASIYIYALTIYLVTHG